MKLSDLKINPNNPQKFDDLNKLKKSIEEFPKMMELRPIIIDNDNLVLGGNKRLICLKKLEYKEIPDEWVKRADELTDEEKQRFIIADNVGFGEWDMDILQEQWDVDLLENWGLELDFNDKKITDISEKIKFDLLVEITVNSEKEQENIYNEFIKKGYKCRILTL